jgi:hypothetical protein
VQPGGGGNEDRYFESCGSADPFNSIAEEQRSTQPLFLVLFFSVLFMIPIVSFFLVCGRLFL